jgi:tripeptide aminopeptidase
MGLPCANIFAGQQLIHSRREFVSVQDMQMAVAVLVKLLGICEQRTKL